MATNKLSTSVDSLHLVVGAIDFGTSYSGYAYSFRQARTNIYRNRWHGSRGLVSEKAPTCILFNKHQKFVNFGFDAEDDFADLCFEKTQDECYFFRGYKMELYNQMVVRKDTHVKDIQGKQLPLLKVVTETIKYLKQEMINDIASRIDRLDDTDVLYVLTVPAIWTDSAKAFMREAAEEAGIPSEQLHICLEPEAAALYCQTVPCQSHRGLSPSQLDLLKTGSRYILIDAGGGTADIIAHEVEENGRLKEILPASGGNWGGTTVDDEFLTCMENVHGMEAFGVFKTKQAFDYFDLMREFEVKKRTRQVQADASKPVVLRVPMSLREMSIRNSIETEAVEDLKSMTLNDDIIRLQNDRFREFFRSSKEHIKTHVAELLEKKGLNDITTLVLVGGYAESKLLQDFIRSEFSSKTLIIPNQPGLAVLKGAVIFGHDPSVIAERACKFTYGIDCCMPFNHEIHEQSTMVTHEDGTKEAEGCFDIHCKVGQNVKTGSFQKASSYFPIRDNQMKIQLPLYACPRANPVYVTEDDCFKIGEMSVDISNVKGSKTERCVLLALCFGGTEITMRATKKQTGEVLSSAIKYDW